MKSLEEYKIIIERGIQELKLPSGKFDTLYEPIKYALSAGGKRIRPVLCLMSADAFGDKSENALMSALGLEIFHNFTLLHDDVMDNSDIRRGRLTVHKKYNENTAILSGDTMLTLATQFISKVDNPILREVLDAFDEMAIRVYEGQQLDMDFENILNIDPDDYLGMIRLKTGELIGASAKIGALIGGASESDAAKMQEFGIMTGIAFQIQDDWLDTFGESTTFGKTIGGDINNAKKTYLYVLALHQNSQMTDALRDAFKIPVGDLRVKTVTRLYEKLGIKEAAKKAVNYYSSLALKALNATSLPDRNKEEFRKFAEKLIGRKK